MIFFFFAQYLIYTPVSEAQVLVDVLATYLYLLTDLPDLYLPAYT